MVFGRQIERRKARHSALKLEHSFLFRISPRYAWGFIIAALIILTAAEIYSPRAVWFGPAYLVVIALATWSLSARLAIVLGLLIIAIKFATNGLDLYPYGIENVVANLGARVAAVLVVIGFIAAARKSCEREWELARRDPLTGAMNRQAFFEIVNGDRGTGGWTAIVYADIDGLKRLNDTEGHERGDQGLRHFSEVIRKTIRKDDVFARMGGDEFVIFMKIKDQDAGAAVARRLHQAINAAGSADSSHLSCSLGILLLPDGSKSIDAELRAADALMYEAKQAGSGVFLSTVVGQDGTMILSPSVAITGLTERETAVRQADRSTAPTANPMGKETFRQNARGPAVSE
tara:strand:+ start:97170 stop:98207 length:1038 start_codon:yes stop_codon:yes gene_type:complete